jgi:hypothetical protein
LYLVNALGGDSVTSAVARVPTADELAGTMGPSPTRAYEARQNLLHA